MSRFFSSKYAALTPYTPGEQPQDMQYVKLNTNESPFPPSEKALSYAREHTRSLNLYSDPDQKELTAAVAALCGVEPENVLMTNGSDEILNFAFMAFCDAEHPAVFPDISYGFYPVFAQLNGIPYTEIPLKDDFTVDVDALCESKGTVFLANPNAPTGIRLSKETVERIVESNPDRIVVVDEAYVDFAKESCLDLVKKHENVLVTQTFSKSRSMAGARLGFGVGGKAIMQDLNTVKYSTNPYNVNSLTAAAAIGTLKDPEYTRANIETIKLNRAYTVSELEKRGFSVLPSEANFIFAMHPDIDGGALYLGLKQRGVLVRHFTKERIAEYNRITIGTREQMDALLKAIDDILINE